MSAAATPPAGYAHPAYADSLAELGSPRRLPRSGGSILVRPVPGIDARDATGPYPLFACERWDELGADLAELEGELVSLVVVADPFGEHSEELLRRAFPDRAVAFKRHFVVELARWSEARLDPHHRRNARRALREVEVERCADPSAWLDDWEALYAALVRRHRIRGAAAFSRASLAGQLRVPGLELLRASRDGETVAMTLWYVHRGVAYYHLGASSDRGYALRASHALFRDAIDRFAAAGAAWLDLGAAPGLREDPAAGLSRFKRGWATGTRSAYLCGRVLSPGAYAAAVRSSPGADAAYFPAYRAGEASASPR